MSNKTQPSETKVRYYTETLRRVLCLNQMLKHEIDGLRESSLCPSLVKVGVKGIDNAIKRLDSDLLIRYPKVFSEVKEELKGDRLHQMAIWMNLGFTVKNAEEIAHLLEDCKAPE